MGGLTKWPGVVLYGQLKEPYLLSIYDVGVGQPIFCMLPAHLCAVTYMYKESN